MSARVRIVLALSLALLSSGLNAADDGATLVKAGNNNFWIDVPAGWLEAPAQDGLTVCAAAATECVVSGVFLVLVPTDASAESADLKMSFNLRTLAPGQTMRQFLDREKACVWPSNVTSLRCILELLPVATRYHSIEHPLLEARGASVSLLEFHPMSGALPLFAVAYVPIGQGIIEITFRAADAAAYTARVGEFRQMLKSYRSAQEVPEAGP